MMLPEFSFFFSPLLHWICLCLFLRCLSVCTYLFLLLLCLFLLCLRLCSFSRMLFPRESSMGRTTGGGDFRTREICVWEWVSERDVVRKCSRERERERELLEPASSWRAFLGRYKLSKDLSRKWTHERILYFRKRIGRYFLKDEKYLFAIQLFDNHYLLWPQNCAGLSNAHTLHRQIICYSFPCDKQNC